MSTDGATGDWNAPRYDGVADPQTRWGAEVLERLPLEASGFDSIETWLSDAPTRFDPGAPFEAFLETVCLRTFLDELPAPEREPFVKAVAARMPEPVLDYVRLNITARRSAAS